jgi:DNA-binding transcriptional LysR family regulator
VTLFDRSAYRIGLTEAGRAFAAEVGRILGDVRNAVLIAKRAARGGAGQVRVGFTESASFNPLVTSAFRAFRSASPDVEVSLEERQSTELALALREGRLDVAFLRPPLKTEEGLTLHLLEEEDMVVAVPSGHPLAKRKEIDLRELATEAFILYPRAVRPGLADAVVAACKKAGFTPRVEQYAPQLSATINLVAASLGISIVPRSMQGLQPQAIAYVPLRGRPVLAQLGIAHRNGETSALTLKFVELARSMGASAPLIAPKRIGVSSRRPRPRTKVAETR